MSSSQALAAAAGLGVLSACAFDPLAIPFAMVVAMVGLILLLRSLAYARTRLIAGVGIFYSLGFMLPLIWWMNAISSGAYIGLVVLETLVFVPIMMGMRAALRLPAWPLWGAAMWVAGEWIRGTFPFSGFPWGRLAHTAIDTPLSSYVRWIATPGTSALMFLLAALIVVIITGGARRAAAVAIVATAVLGWVLPTGIAGAGETRQVSLVQGDVPGVFLSWPRGEIFELHAAETDRLADQVDAGAVPAPDFVLWPENATDIDPYFDPQVRGEIERLSGRLQAPILVGGIFDGPTVETALNAGVVWTETGPQAQYIKRKLVPYGEYVPFRQQLGRLVPRIDRDIPRDMVPGDQPGALSIGNTIIGDTICWDIAYDSVVHDAIDAGAQVLVVQTSNASFTGTSQPEQQWKISRLRAIETGRWVLVPSTNGISGIVDPHGRSVKRAQLNEPSTLSAEVTLANDSTWAVRFGSVISVTLVTAGLLGWGLGTRREEDA